jgi:DNA-binding beta-propeller fold protein YncE
VFAAAAVLFPSEPALGQAGDIGVYADAGGTSCNILDITVTQFQVVHKNTPGATAVQFSAPLPAAYTGAGGIYLGDAWNFGVFLGDSQTGVAVAYDGNCLSGPIHIGTIIGFSNGLTPACTSYPVLPHPLAPSGQIEVADCSPIALTLVGQGSTATINGNAGCPCGFGVFSVTNTNDSGAGSLRQAITDANNNVGSDIVDFNIAGTGPHTIQPLSGLPSITDPVTIDGYTQPGASMNTNAGFAGSNATLMIDLDGSLTTGVPGLNILSGGCIVRGLVVRDFDGVGINLQVASGNSVEGCFVGTNSAGTSAQGNSSHGVSVGSSGNIVGGTSPGQRNVISGNGANGVLIAGASVNNAVLGNFIGTNAAGTGAVGNAVDGILITGGSTAAVGGTTAGAGNLIAGNSGIGLQVSSSSGSSIEGNRIGTSVSGTGAIANGSHGISIDSGSTNNTVGGSTTAAINLISGNGGAGVVLNSFGTTINMVKGNYIGTDVGGTSAVANTQYGVRVFNCASNTIGGTTTGEGNLISGNGFDGVSIAGASATENTVHGNWIGVDVSGGSALGNANGVSIADGAAGNFIGGPSTAEANVISGNTAHGIDLDNTSFNLVRGNAIGTDPTGLLAVANGAHGVHINFGASDNTIGGANAGEGNLISGNAQSGVAIINATTTQNTVQGNGIGIALSLVSPLANGAHGVAISDSPNNTIGGTAPGARNFIGGNNANGVYISLGNATGNVVHGNDIGGAAALSNGLSGVFIGSGASNNSIGGVNAGEPNLISFNTLDGVTVESGTGNEILGNEVVANGTKGIDLGNDNLVAANDPADVDVGANNLQNFPVLTAVSSASTTVQGTFNSTPNTQFRLEFFGNAACDASLHGEGEIYLGFISVTTDGSGDAPFNDTFPTTVPLGDYVTATATDPNGNTSEFSQCAQVAAPALPDFEVVSFSGPLAASLGDDVSGDLSLTITNSGEGDATVSFSVAVYHSIDAVLDANDFFLGGSRVTIQSLAADDTAQVSFNRATIPFTAASGMSYLIAAVDDLDEITEEDGADNTASSPITIADPPVTGEVALYFDAGLTQRSKNCPGVALDTLYVAAENLGAFISAIEYRIEYPPTITFIADLQTPPVTIGNSPDGISLAWALPQDAFGQLLVQKVLFQWNCTDCSQPTEFVSVEPHQSFPRVQALRWPDDLFLFPAGQVSYICPRDLQVVSFSGPADAELQEDISGAIDLRVRNAGTADITTGFEVGLYLSADLSIDRNDEFISRRAVPSLAAGDTASVSFTVAEIPFMTQFLGGQHLGVIADELEGIPEIDETNNTATSPINLDLPPAVGQVALYFDEDLTQRDADCPGPGVLDTVYVVIEDLSSFISGAEYQIDYPPIMTWIADVGTPPVTIGNSKDGISVAWALPQDANGQVLMHTAVVEWDCDQCSQFDDPISVVPHPEFGLVQALQWPSGKFIVSTGATSYLCVDTDGDGVFNGRDQCPADNAAPYDADGDGCVDLTASNRHIEYWRLPDFPLTYMISQEGAPGINDGSEFTEVVNAMSTWNTVAGSEAAFVFGGQIPQNDAQAMDLQNTVTFNDPDFQFPPGVLAVGISTSFTDPTFFNDQLFREGQVFDADMIFNNAITFSTPTDGSGPPIKGVTVHEAGHWIALSHSLVETSTMAYVLAVGAETLETEDSLTVFMAYGDPAAIAAASQLGGTITDGFTNNPIPAAAVFAIDATSGDTSGCAITLEDGSYVFVGLPNGQYYVSIYQIDGSSAINYIRTANINEIVFNAPIVDFVPESWDLAESKMDNSFARDAITVAAGNPMLDVDIVTNVDETPPTVTSVTPADNDSNVPIGSAVLIKFSEAINTGTIQGNLSLEDLSASMFLGGSVAILGDDSLLAFIPSGVEFDSDYELKVKTGLTDKFNNPIASEFVSHFHTELQPDVFITALQPNSGPVGSVIVIDGEGFSAITTENEVRFDGLLAAVSNATPMQLTVTVPEGASSGQVHVVNLAQQKTSNQLPFTILVPQTVAKGFDAGNSTVGATPRALTLLPDASRAVVVTTLGLSVVETDANQPNFLASQNFTVTGGLDDIDATPLLTRVYAISRTNQKFYRIKVDDNTPPIVVENEVSVGNAIPLGVLVEPGGERAFVATDVGKILIFDLNQANPTFDQQIGFIESDPNLTGEMEAVGGQYLLALTGTGRMLAYSLSDGSQVGDVPAGFDPRGIAADPAGVFAYVGNDNGTIVVIDLTTMTNVASINTGGKLRSPDVTPDGAFLVIANREANLFYFLDLRLGPTFRQVVATPEIGTNPVASEIGSNALYAFSASEFDQTLVATAIGVGPTLSAVKPIAGPLGSKLVLSGLDFTADDTTRVSFDGVIVPQDVLEDGRIVVTVPPTASSGPVTVVGTNIVGPPSSSNAIFFEVLGATPTGGIRISGAAQPTGTPGLNSALSMSPTGSYAVVGGDAGVIYFLDTDVASPTFNQFFDEVAVPPLAQVDDVALTPDGKRGFAVEEDGTQVPVIATDRFGSDFKTILGTVDLGAIPGVQIARAAVSPDGRTLLLSDPATAAVHFVDIEDGSPQQYQPVAAVPLAGLAGTNGEVREMAFDPTGQYAYLAIEDPTVAAILVLDVAGKAVVGNVLLPGPSVPDEVPLSMGFYPDGSTCLVLTSQIVGPPTRSLVALDTSIPINPSIINSVVIPSGAAPTREHVRVSPAGDRAIVNIRDAGYYYFDVQNPNNMILTEIAGDVFHHLAPIDFDYTPDASGFYAVSSFRDTAFVQDFAQAQDLALQDGDGQSGVAGHTLPAPIRVKATNSGSGTPAAGVAVTFEVLAGGGVFVGTGTSTQVVVTNVNGIAGADWTLGPDIGLGVHQASATALGLSGSPVGFTADAVVDPETVPMFLVSVAPEDNAQDVSITTTTQAVFSRAVDPNSVDPTTLVLREGSAIVPVNYGFSDQNRRVSMTPLAPLNTGATYAIDLPAGILDASGGPLDTPTTTTFQSQPPPPLSINSVDPPSGTVGVPVVISGTGIDPNPANMVVTFSGNVQAVVASAGADFLGVDVPVGAVSGPITVQRTAAANAPGQAGSSVLATSVDFTVLIPTAEVNDEVIGNVGTGADAPRGIAITPDATRAYATSENVVISINVETLESGDVIGVMQDPSAIVIGPDGRFAYVSNFNSATVSVLDIDPASDDFETNIANLDVGLFPIDLAVHPDGDRVFVANAGTNDISIIDADELSASFNSVIGNFGGGGSGTVRSLSITPDGTRMFVGTDLTIEIFDARNLADGVIGNLDTGNTGIRSISVTPDAAKVVALTVGGVIAVFDIVPNSPTENQVIGVFGGGDQLTRSQSITPDGTQIWAVQELGDEILVLSLDFTGAVSVLGEIGGNQSIPIPPTAVQLDVLATVDAGEDPFVVVFSADGTTALVTNPVTQSITVFNPEGGEAEALVHVAPRQLNTQARNRWINGSIELPTSLDPADIDITTVVLAATDFEGSEVPAQLDKWEISDKDTSGVDELHVKFERVDFQDVMPEGDTVLVEIRGMVADREFIGGDTIRTHRPKIKHPDGGETLFPNNTVKVRWVSPDSVHVDSVDVYWTFDDGWDWQAIASGMPDVGEVDWVTPDNSYGLCRVMVTIYQDGEDIGAGMSQEVFAIDAPVPVTLAGFQIVQARRAAKLQWTTGIETDVRGFHILRSQNEEFGYAQITSELIPASGRRGGASYEFEDDTVRPNNTYFYRLQEVAEGREGQVFGPYKFRYAARFALEQNIPNPFNPTTVIQFTLPADGHVSLVIYDVAGRRVRTLVNEKRRADHYEVKWDGKDANGRTVASGVYFYRIQAGKHRATRKMVMLK